MLPMSWKMTNFDKRFRSFTAENFKSVGQRAAKLLAVKVGALKKKSTALAITAKACASILLGPSSSLSGYESFSNFEGQQICGPLYHLYEKM